MEEQCFGTQPRNCYAVGISVRVVVMSSLFPAAAPALLRIFDDGSGGAESHGADGASGHLFTRHLLMDF